MDSKQLATFRTVLEKQEASVLEGLKTLPDKDQKMLLSSWREIKKGNMTAEQFKTRLKNYASK